MPPAPPAHDPHAFPFCPRCGAYRHQGPCPQPQPLPPTPTMLTPLSSLLSSPPASHAAPPSSSSSSPPPPPRRLASAHYAPSATPANPLEPSISQIVLGIALIALGAWLLLSGLPPHRPLSEGEVIAYMANRVRDLQDPTQGWFFRPAAYYSLCVFSALLCLAGLQKVLSGCLRRAYALTACRKCKRRVWARRFGAQLRCPNGDHLTHLSSAARIALAVLIAFLALVAIGLIVNANQ